MTVSNQTTEKIDAKINWATVAGMFNLVSVQGVVRAARDIESAEESSLGRREGEELPLLEARITSVINSKTIPILRTETGYYILGSSF